MAEKKKRTIKPAAGKGSVSRAAARAAARKYHARLGIRPLLTRISLGGYPHSFLLAVGATAEQIERALSKVPRGYRTERSPAHRCKAPCWTPDNAEEGWLTLPHNVRGALHDVRVRRLRATAP